MIRYTLIARVIMRASDLNLRDLLEFDEGGGVIRFAGRRALVMDAAALGILRRELIDTVGLAAAREILARFGYAHGYVTAESLRDLPWDSERDWRSAGPPRVHRSQKLFESLPKVLPRCTSQLFLRPRCPLKFTAFSSRRPDVFHVSQWFPFTCAHR